MNCLVIAIPLMIVCVSQTQQIDKRSLFSWKSDKKPEVEAAPHYLPILKVHKYNGIQIDPVQGPSVYLPDGIAANSFESDSLSSDQLQQLNMINRLVTFFPDENNLQDYDFSSILPYAKLIPDDDTLEKIEYSLETLDMKEKTKLLKFIAFIKYLKEKKLKPLKFAANLGNKIANQKKEKLSWLLGKHTTTTTTTTTPAPYVTEWPSSFIYSNGPLSNHPHFAAFYPNQIPKFSETELSAAEAPTSFPTEMQAHSLNLFEPIKFSFPAQFQGSFQQNPPNFPSQYFPNQKQFSTPAPTTNILKYSYPALSQAPLTDPQNNGNSNPSFEYKQPPAGTHQILNKNELYDTIFDSQKSENQPSYQNPTKDQSNLFNYAASKLPIPSVKYTISYPSSPLDLTASGSENVENVSEHKPKDDRGNIPTVTTTEQPTSPKSTPTLRRIKLRSMLTKEPINADNLKEQNSLGDKSSSNHSE